ncbi:MAG: hypothetical protein NZV14_01255 [Bryobacteraceae bacterium]|nr:hypothetical protein [Bryobacteraceae bacterium]MDW8376757.1 hypothetical protein [Bryobacterales bacterium]
MKRFRFELDPALRWRKQRLDLHQAKLQQLNWELGRVRAASQQLASDYQQAEAFTRSHSEINAADLQALAAYRYAIDERQRQLRRQEAQLVEDVERQRRLWMEEARQLQLLEKLKQRKRQEWSQQLAREIDQQASEAYLAQWKRGER